MRYFILSSIFLLLLLSCSNENLKNLNNSNKNIPYKKQLFLENPFGFEPNFINFSKYFVPPLHVQNFTVINQHYPEKKDTIIKFSNGKTELFLYKTNFNRELFFAGNITLKSIRLINGVHVGMHRGAFFNCFSDLKYSDNDTVKIKSTGIGSEYKFVFKKDYLRAINIKYTID